MFENIITVENTELADAIWTWSERFLLLSIAAITFFKKATALMFGEQRPNRLFKKNLNLCKFLLLMLFKKNAPIGTCAYLKKTLAPQQ